MRPHAGSGCGNSNICIKSVSRIFRHELAVAMPDYSQKGYSAKCAGMADNLIKELKNRPSGVSRAAFLRELCMFRTQFYVRV